MTDDLAPRAVLAVVMTLSGVLMIWMARATASGRLGRNHISGIRTPATLASDEAWLAAHRRARRSNEVGGVVAFATAALAFLPLPVPVVGAAVLVACLVLLAVVLHGARVGARAARDSTDHASTTRAVAVDTATAPDSSRD